MFLLVSIRHVDAHPGGYQHGVSIQISINLGKFHTVSSCQKFKPSLLACSLFVTLTTKLRSRKKSSSFYTNSLNWSLYDSKKNKLREFDKRSKHFPLGDYFINSHNLFSWLCFDNVRRKLMFVISSHFWDLNIQHL